MSETNPSSTPTEDVLSDPSAEIRFGFSARSRIQGTIEVNESSPYVASVENPMPAKTDIVFADDMGNAVLTPAGYTMSMNLRRISPRILNDKFETAVTYLDKVITDNSRNFNPAIIVAGNDPTTTFDEFEETLRSWGSEKFDTTGEKSVLGSNKQVSLKFKNGKAVKL